MNDSQAENEKKTSGNRQIERHTEKESERELEKYNVARQARKGEGRHRAGRLLDALLVGG